MAMNTPRDLFLHELADTLSAEHIIAKMIPPIAGKVKDEELRDAMRAHAKETKQHIKNLEACFKALSEQPEQMVCHGAEGLQKEVDAFLEEQPVAEILTLFAAGAAGKTEQYEIESYTGLIDMAKLLGEKEVVKLLQENLKQEQAMSKTVEAVEKRLGKELITSMREAEAAAANAG
jgi:ferritin-like metal-binding protein YciE